MVNFCNQDTSAFVSEVPKGGEWERKLSLQSIVTRQSSSINTKLIFTTRMTLYDPEGSYSLLP